MTDRDPMELAWAAGFFDGEGSSGCYTGGLSVTVVQKDRRALDRFQAVMGFGKVTGPWGNGKRGYIYRYQLSRFEHAQAAMALLWSRLGPAKREQFRLAVTKFLERPRKAGTYRTVCVHGHSLEEAYVRPNGNRSCRPCSAKAQQRYHARKSLGVVDG